MDPKTKDILLGGVGGAVAAVVLTLILDSYFDAVSAEARIDGKREIIEAKNKVIDEIRSARKDEKEHLYDAIAAA